MIQKLFKKNKLDERQLQIRGNIYYRGLTIVSTLVILDFYVCTFFKYDWIVGKWDSLIILFVGITYITIEMIRHEIYPLTSAKYRLFFIFVIAFGTVFSLLPIHAMVQRGLPFLENYQITNIGAFLLFASMYVMIGIAYIVKIIYNKRCKSEGDD